MSFYISPPGGNISLQKLSQFAVTRFNFLVKIYDTGGDRVQIFDILNDEEQVHESECLIEGTVKDRLSHFVLRLACCCDRDMAEFLVKAETLLFDFRFNCMTEDELCNLFKSVDYLRHGSRAYDLPSYVTQFLKTMSLIKGDIKKWRTVVKKYLKGDMDCFMLPFLTVLQFVATRQVVLKHGIAHVPIFKLRETVTSLFEELIQKGVKHAAKVFKTEDKRIKILLKTIKAMFYKHYKDKYPGSQHFYDLCHTEVDNVTQMFPPCMSHLHRSLRMSHRLKHHSRIQYSLFLKEIGLPIHEALMFWRKEYMQSPNKQDGCQHLWSKDEGRYTYNIRHLYGLEGSRINYRGHSCAALQENYHGPHENGGCPFSHFDSSHLLDLLYMDGISSASSTDKILKLSEEKQYSQACALYFMLKIQEKEYETGLLKKINHKYCDKCESPESGAELVTVLGNSHQDNVINNNDIVGTCTPCDTDCNHPDTSSCISHDEIQYNQKKCLCDSGRQTSEGDVMSKTKSSNYGFVIKHKSIHDRHCTTSCQSVVSDKLVKDTASDSDLSNCDCFDVENIANTKLSETKFDGKKEMMDCHEHSGDNMKVVLKPAEYYYIASLN